MRRKLNKLLLAAAVACALGGGGLTARRASAQTTTPGTWTLYPAQTVSYTTSVRPPIKADGSSVFKSSTPTIPVKFKLSVAPSPLKFWSVWSNNQPPPGGDPDDPAPEPVHEDDYSYLSFEPGAALAFGDLSVLKANYTFTQGDCGGGALRWQVRLDVNNDDDQPLLDENGDPVIDGDGNMTFPGLANDRSIFIYYGGHPNFTDCTAGANNQSGVNLMTLTDLRFDTSQLAGGTFYDTAAHAQTVAGAWKVISASLVLDAGWRQDSMGNYLDQKVSLGTVTINTNEFTPLTGDASTTCNLPQAQISVVRLEDGAYTDPVSVQRPSSNVFFGTSNDCTYTYNLSTSSLLGPGTYKVEAYIDGLVPGGAVFKIQ